MKLSILIPTLDKRNEYLNRLLYILDIQINELNLKNEVEILMDNRPEGISIGTKRNDLLAKSNGLYTCFIDDDDEVSSDYLENIMIGINENKDCCSLKGVMTTNGFKPEIFEHSIKYKEYKTTENEIKYERYPNHLNCINSEISKKFKFPESNWGEDTNWATQLYNSGVIKTEYYIENIIYYYKYRTKK